MKTEQSGEIKHIYLEQLDGAEGLQKALASCNGEPTEILLASGSYFFDQSIVMEAAQSNITIKGEGRVRLIGGKRLHGWHPVEDPAVLRRIDEDVRGKVLECDLTENGVMETGKFSRRGFGVGNVPSHAEIFIDGEPMFVSQYPKRGQFLKVSGYVEEIINECEERIGKPERGFHYDDERPSHWAPNDDLWVHGYWCWDWANTYEHVTMLDTATKTVEDAPPHCVRGFKPGQRFYFLNILEEVNTPGDYYIDRSSNKLYFYPETIQDDTEVLISMLETPLFELRGSENVRLENLELECVRGKAVYTKDTNDFVVDNCQLKNIGNIAVVVEGGKRNAVRNSTIHHCGDGGIQMFGGDRMTLEHADSEICNNHIYKVGLWSRCYKHAINPSGVGISITHNLIHDCPHIAILYGGNDMTIEYNEIYSVCLETGDAGAIYAGRDVTFRGNHVSHNYIHHMGGVGLGTMGIYNEM